MGMATSGDRRTRWTALVFAALAAVSMGLTSTAAADESDDDEPRDSAEMSAEDYAERMQHFYAETDDFQSSFVQTYPNGAAGESSQSYGMVYFKKPGMMRWDYYDTETEDREWMLVSDGDMFFKYEFEYQQVFRECLDDQELPAALRFLMGEGEILEEFEVELADESTDDEPILTLSPKEPTSEYKKLRFSIDPDSYQVEGTILYDPYGNTNEIEFRDSRVNSGLSADGFEFETPAGARELNPEKTCD